MLRTRILTALVLFAVFVSALFFLPVIAWVTLSTLVASMAAWEWGALQKRRASERFALGLATFLLVSVAGWLFPEALGLAEITDATSRWSFARWFYIPSALFWLVVVPLWMRFRWTLPRNLVGVLVGMVVILPTWLALIQLRQLGPWALVGLMMVIWVADTGAYFCGRGFGRRKLAPTISPGKTWEGAFGGAALVLLYGVTVAFVFDLPLARNLPVLVAGMLAFALLSVIGDLFESLLKRQSGLKDSSSILPGHGGILDRIDSLTSTLPLVALVWLLELF